MTANNSNRLVRLIAKTLKDQPVTKVIKIAQTQNKLHFLYCKLNVLIRLPVSI
ncbi:MAG: hypothetical protein CM15mP85_17410 [Rhodobacterales bacterium]|nr:MAG: hypothetical protein CM15mP85_17410 [Rhodobacterales bacterium]